MVIFGWVILAAAFLVFIAVSNNSWPAIVARLQGAPPGPVGQAASATGAAIRQVVPEVPKPPDTPTTTHVYVPGEGWIEVPNQP